MSAIGKAPGRVDVLRNPLNNQDRIKGGYEVIGFVRNDLNHVGDLRAATEANPDLAFVERVDGVPSVGAFRTVYQADARPASDLTGAHVPTTLPVVGDDFFESNQFGIALTVP